MERKQLYYISNTGAETIDAVNFKRIAEAIKFLQNNFADQLAFKMLA